MTQTDELIKHLDKLNASFAKSFSLPRVFIRGIVGGVGTAIGASLVAGVLIAFLVRFISSFNYVPFMQNIQSVITPAIYKSTTEY